MVNYFFNGRKTYFKVKPIKAIRRLHCFPPARENATRKRGAAEVTSSDVTFESVKEALVHIGLLDRFKKLNSNNSKAPGTALTRLEDMAIFFGIRPPLTGKVIITFFVSLTPDAIERLPIISSL